MIQVGERRGNPGADFFGFTQADENKLYEIFESKVTPLIKKNVTDELMKAAK